MGFNSAGRCGQWCGCLATQLKIDHPHSCDAAGGDCRHAGTRRSRWSAGGWKQMEDEKEGYLEMKQGNSRGLETKRG